MDKDVMEKIKSCSLSRLDKAVETDVEISSWPSSNYPIFIALMLLTATAASLAIGDEKRAEDLAIYAYYFLVMGVVIRFIEHSLPEGSQNRLLHAWKHSSDLVKQHGAVVIQKIEVMLKNLYSILQPFLHKTFFEFRMRISKQHPQEKINSHVQNIGNNLGRLYMMMRRLHIAEPEKSIVVISDISRNIAIYLSIFFIISLIYGWIIDWWFVEKYLSNLVLLILGFVTLHIFTRVRF